MNRWGSDQRHVETAALELCKNSPQRGRVHSIPMLEMGSEKAFVDLLNILKFEYDLIGYIVSDGILSLGHNFQFWIIRPRSLFTLKLVYLSFTRPRNEALDRTWMTAFPDSFHCRQMGPSILGINCFIMGCVRMLKQRVLFYCGVNVTEIPRIETSQGP